MTKAEEGESVKLTIDLKAKITSALAKYNRLNICLHEVTPTTTRTARGASQPGLGSTAPSPRRCRADGARVDVWEESACVSAVRAGPNHTPGSASNPEEEIL